MGSKTLNEANINLRHTFMDDKEGRNALSGVNPLGGYTRYDRFTLSAEDNVIPVAANLSAGITLPVSHTTRQGTFYGTTIQTVQATYDALSAANKDINVLLLEAEWPIGSEVQLIAVTAGVVSGSTRWHKTAASTWTNLSL